MVGDEEGDVDTTSYLDPHSLKIIMANRLNFEDLKKYLFARFDVNLIIRLKMLVYYLQLIHTLKNVSCLFILISLVPPNYHIFIFNFLPPPPSSAPQ